jgi:Fic/DOC family
MIQVILSFLFFIIFSLQALAQNKCSDLFEKQILNSGFNNAETNSHFQTFSQISSYEKFKKYGNELQPQENKRVLSELQQQKAMYAFLELFDVFDIATMNHAAIGEKLSYKKMKSAANTYQEQISRLNLKKITTAEQFMRSVELAFHLKYTVRNYDVVMGSYNKQRPTTIGLAQKAFEILSKNKFLSLKKLRTLQRNHINFFETEVTYFNIDKSEAIATLFTKNELLKIQTEISKNTKSSEKFVTKFILNLMLQKLFDPTYFQKLCELQNEALSARTLYKIFVSAHPFSDGNGRAARLYYKWLVENYFQQEHSTVFNLINEFDLLENNIDEKANAKNWTLTRAWIMSAPTESEMQMRAQNILKNDPEHLNRGLMLLDFNEILNERSFE